MNKEEKILSLSSLIRSLRAYKRSFNMISKRVSNTHIRAPYIEVAATIWGIGVEKSIKGLISYLDGHSPPRIHNLMKLAEKLEKETLGLLILLSGHKPRHFWAMLDQNKNSFVDWRYASENSKQITFISWEDPVGIIDAAILMLTHEKTKLIKSK